MIERHFVPRADSNDTIGTPTKKWPCGYFESIVADNMPSTTAVLAKVATLAVEDWQTDGGDTYHIDVEMAGTTANDFPLTAISSGAENATAGVNVEIATDKVRFTAKTVPTGNIVVSVAALPTRTPPPMPTTETIIIPPGAWKGDDTAGWAANMYCDSGTEGGAATFTVASASQAVATAAGLASNVAIGDYSARFTAANKPADAISVTLTFSN